MRTEAAGLLLDTHVWIWLNEGLPELSAQQRQRIDDAARRGQAWVSIIGVGSELAALEATPFPGHAPPGLGTTSIGGSVSA